jgi:PAS domain S-box-containing protein
MIAMPKFGVRSLRFKLAFTSALVEVVMLAILISNSVSIATQALEEQTRYRVSELVPLLNASLASPLVQRDYATLDEILTQVVRKGGIEYIGVSDEDQHLVAAVGERPESDEEHGQYGDINDLTSYRHLNFPISLVDVPVGRLQMSVNTAFLQLTIDTLLREGMLIAGGEVVITVMLLVLVGVLLTRHLAVLVAAARAMSAGNLAVRVNIRSHDEIGDTARAFNGMAARLETSYDSLKKSEQRYQVLTELSPVGIFNTNAEGQCIYVNERYSEITGFPQQQFYGTGWGDILHPEDQKRVLDEWERCVENGAPYTGEYRIISADGNVVWVYVQAVKSGIVDGGYVGTVTNVTRLKSVEQELAHHRDSLEELVAERTEELNAAQNRLLRQERLATLGQLTATVSHELRNPLGVINNAAYILKRKFSNLVEKRDSAVDDELKDKFTYYLEMITREVTAADRIIADLLATSRTKTPVLQWVNLDDVLSAIIEQNLFPENIQWDYQSTSSPFMLRADPLQLTQVLKNLLINAVQAIVAAGIKDGVVRLVASEMGGQYQLRISDNGPGVEESNRAQIFEPLFTTKAKGNGLGLWISREIIRAHGGELCLEPSQNEVGGAVFVIILPRGVSDGRAFLSGQKMRIENIG